MALVNLTLNLVLHCVTDSCNHGFNFGLVLVTWSYHNGLLSIACILFLRQQDP